MNLIDSINQALSGALMFFAIHAGTVPAQKPQVVAPVHRQAAHQTPLPQRRPNATSIPIPTSRPESAIKVDSSGNVAVPAKSVTVEPLAPPKLRPTISDTASLPPITEPPVVIMPRRLPATAFDPQWHPCSLDEVVVGVWFRLPSWMELHADRG